MKNNFLALMLAVIALSSCNAPNQKELTNSKLLIDKINTVAVPADSGVVYSVFIPETTKKTLPVIFFFDPHGNGKLPLEYYCQLADKYQFILIGSMNLRNGMPGEQMQHIFNTMYTDVLHRYAVNKSSVYLAGFSGGAKVAMMFGMQMPQMAGVIACGGSINPQGFNRSNFSFIGIVGNKDFNYLEMLQTFSVFDQNGQSFSSVVFDGKHEWPPVDTFEKAFIAIQAQAMTDNTIKTDKAWLKAIANEAIDKSDAKIKEGNLLDAYEILAQAELWTKSLGAGNEVGKKLDELEKNAAFTKLISKQQMLAQKEVELRGRFIQSIDEKDLNWWKDEVNKIRENTQVADELIALTSSRLLNYLSMASFMLVNADLLNQNLESAHKRIQIYELVDPENPDVYLMYARYYLGRDERTLMVDFVQKAIDKGFKSPKEYSNDPNFAKLFSQPEIKNLLSLK